MSSSWWFGAFREHGAPTWYGENRTPILADITTIKVVFLFAIFLVAFLVIFPGVRRAKWSSFVSIVMALMVGALLIISTYYPSWHVAEVWIFAPYKSFSSYRVNALLGVNIGLTHVNITLKGYPENENNRHMNYNERFAFYKVKSMQNDLREGLNKGLPYPVLSVIEYFTVDKAGFIWGRRYRLAGYYTCILLWLSFALWLLHLLILCLVPQFYSRTLMCLGVCILLADGVFVTACPKTLYIPFPNAGGATQRLIFEFGWCLWSTLGAGFSCFTYAVVIRVLEAKSDYKFNTFLQFDSDEELYCNNKNKTCVSTLEAALAVSGDVGGGSTERRFDDQHQSRAAAAVNRTPSSGPSPDVSCCGPLDQFVEEEEPSPTLSVMADFSIPSEELRSSYLVMQDETDEAIRADSAAISSSLADAAAARMDKIKAAEDPVNSAVQFSLIIEEEDEDTAEEKISPTTSSSDHQEGQHDKANLFNRAKIALPTLPLSDKISSFEGSLLNVGVAARKATSGAECIRRPSTKLLRRRSSHLSAAQYTPPYLIGSNTWCDETTAAAASAADSAAAGTSSTFTGSGSRDSSGEPSPAQQQCSEVIDLSFPGFDDAVRPIRTDRDHHHHCTPVFQSSVLSRRVGLGGGAAVTRSASKKLQRRASNPVNSHSTIVRRYNLQ